MLTLIINWFLSTLSLMIVSYLVPGFEVRGFSTALIAAVVIGLINATLGFVLKILTFPLSILTFGLFLLVINALMLQFATLFVPGFEVRGCIAAFLGAIVLALVGTILHHLVFKS